MIKYSPTLTYRLHRLDLTKSIDALFRSFHKDCVQRKIRRSERENLTYEEGTSTDLLQKFYKLMALTRKRQGLPPQPFKWFDGLVMALGNHLKIRVASVGHVPVASIITISHKKTMTYKYGCSDAAYNKLGGMALLFWRTIQEAKADGYRELDLGRSDSDNLGLIAFKNHWGAAASSLTYWKYPPPPPARRRLWQHALIKRGLSSTPTFVLTTVGQLLYKHIG
jgi:lipid II:glycine glycyltransferase (peptidoglycan interpeptide bridge formation enzyme)